MRILISRLSALGDVIHTWPLAVAASRLPEVTAVAWLVEEPFAPLLVDHPAVTEIIPVATRRWRRHPHSSATRAAVAEARARLRTFAPDVVLDPQGLLKSAVWARLSGARHRVGFSSEQRRELLAGLFYTDRVRPPETVRHVVDLNLTLLTALQAAPPYGAAPDGRHLLRPEGPRPEPGTVTLLPATGGHGKRWPSAAFAELSHCLRATGRPVAVAWGPDEEALARTVVDTGGQGVVMAPPTTLSELAGYLAGSAVVVGGDTGPVHLAASLGTPTVAVFVATDPERNGPRGNSVTVLSAAAGGARRGRARTATAGTVTVERVFETLLGLLGQVRR